MLLEEKYSTNITKGFILYGKKGKTIPIEITQGRRKTVLDFLEKIISSGNKGVIPASDASTNKCSQCEYLNFCADRM